MDGNHIQYSTLSNISDVKEWDDFILKHPQGTPYHLSSWIKTLSETYKFKDYLLIHRDKNSTIKSIFPLFEVPKLFSAYRYISLPFSDYGGPLCSSGTDQTLLVQKFASDHMKNKKVIEVRSSLVNSSMFKPFVYYKRHTLNLERDIKDIEAGINKKTIRRSIRKAEKSGISVSFTNERQAFATFYRLNNLTRKKHGVPGQPYKFFENLYKNIIEPGDGFIALAHHETIPIAASIFITMGNQIHYKYNASDPAALKTLTPNHLLLWNTIKMAKEQGFHTLDFGRTSPDNEGLMRYKNSWGTECSDAPYSFYPQIIGTSTISEKSKLYSLANTIWSKLPNVVTEAINPMVYRYLG